MTLSASILELLGASVGADHRDGSAQVVYVLKASPMSLVTSTVEALYFASTTFRTSSSDTPANTLMQGTLIPPNVRVSIVNGDRVGGIASITRGTIKILNPRGQYLDRNDDLTDDRGLYDSLANEYSWIGRALSLYIGPEDGSFTDFELLFGARVEDFSWSEDEIEIRPSGGMAQMDLDVQRNYYGQTYRVIYDSTAGEDGLEGTADDQESITVYQDLSGVPKPLVFGRCLGIEPVCLSKTNEIYQVMGEDHPDIIASAGAWGVNRIEEITAVYEDGLELELTTDYTVDEDKATLTLVSATTGIITADVSGAIVDKNDTYIDRPASIIGEVLTNWCNGHSLNATSSTAYDAQFNYETGIYFKEPTERSEFLEGMLAPMGYAYRSRGSQILLGWLKNPADESVDLTLTEADIESVNHVSTLPPAWRVRIGYAPVGRPIDYSDFAGAVTEAEIARQSQPYRWVEAVDDGLLSLHRARDLSFTTRFISQADAEALAASLLALYKEPRDILEVKLLNKFMQYDIGDIVRLGWKRYNIIDDGAILQETGDYLLQESDSDYILTDYIRESYFAEGGAIVKEEHVEGRKFMVVGYVDNPGSNEFSVMLWG